MRRLGMVLAAVVIVVAGCTAAPDTDPTAPPSSTATEAGVPGRTLASLGYESGPVAAIAIPDDAQLVLGTDQFNVVTAVFATPDAQTLVEFFRRSLPDGGFTIGADDGGALVFTGHGWEGAFTPGGEGRSALSLRLIGH